MTFGDEFAIDVPWPSVDASEAAAIAILRGGLYGDGLA